MRLLTSPPAWTRAGRFLVLGSLLLAPLPAAAQQGSGTVKGTVTQASNGQALAGVIVTVSGTTIKGVTNTRGVYTIDRAPTGPQTLVFRWLGYKPTEMPATVATSGETTVDAKMEQLPIQLSELTVTGASRVPERAVEAPAAFTIVEPRVLQATGITGQAPMALREVPGVDIVQSGVNDFNVNTRGFNSTLNRRVLVLQDGRDLAIAFLGSQEWNALAVPTDEYSKMELVRGPGSALYGANAFFGVLNITTPTAREVAGTKVTFGGGQLGTVRADLRHAGVMGRGRWGYRLNGGFNSSDSWSRSRTNADSLDLQREYGAVVDDPATNPIPKVRERRALNGQTADPTTGVLTGEADKLQNVYGSARLDYYANNGAVLTAESGIAQVENEIFVTGIGRVQVTKAIRPYARLGWAHNTFNVMAYWNGRNSKEPQYSLASGAELREKSNILHIEAQDVRRFDSDKGRIVYGSSARNYRVNTDSTLMRAADDDRSDYYYAVFGQVEYELTPYLRGVVAARFDVGSLISPQFSPKVALVASPNDKHSFRFTINRAFQTPNYSEFYLRAAAAAPANFAALEAALRASPLGPVLAGVPDGKLFSVVQPTAATASGSSSVPILASGNNKLDVETTLGFEVGYRSDVSPSVYVTIDAYYNRIKNFVTDLLPGVNPTQFPYWTAPNQVPAGNRAALVTAVRNALLSNPASVTAGRGLTRTEDGGTAVVVTYANAGKVEQWGLEGGAGWQLSRTLRTDGTVTLFDYSVDESTVQQGDSLLANTPSLKGTASLSFADKQFSASANVRAVKGYSWAAGAFNGFIEPNVSVGANAAYDVNNNFKVFVAGTNLFDSNKFEIYGGSVIGRRILGGVTARF